MKEKQPVYDYKVPDEFKNLSESRAVAVELLDELFNKALGIHILEPIVTFKEV